MTLPVPRLVVGSLALLAMGAPLAMGGCDDVGLLTPLDVADVTIGLEVSGGVAGVSYAIVVDGARREVIGESCAPWCSVEPGGVILPVSGEQVAAMASALEDADITALDGRDFGVDCCDRFGYVVRYRNGDRTARVSGGGDRLPSDLARVVGRLHGLVQGVLPALVSPDTRDTDWPRDAYELGPTSVDGLTLDAEVRYGGGCAQHRIDLVVWGDWIEPTSSSPPHVNALLSHDDGGDTCEAFLTDERSFDLGPLRDAYERTFGPIGDARPTVVLRLWDPMSANPLGRLVEVEL